MLPIAIIEPWPLEQLAGLIAGVSAQGAPGFYLPNKPDISSKPEENKEESQLDKFWHTASPNARRLAKLLAAAPRIRLPIIRLIRAAMLKDATHVHEAEFLLSGLLEVTHEPDNGIYPDRVDYDFISGVREELLDSLSVIDARKVLEKVSLYVEDHLGEASGFAAVLANPTGDIDSVQIGELSESFATIATSVLKRLGGRYAKAINSLTLKETNGKQIRYNEKFPAKSTNRCLNPISSDEILKLKQILNSVNISNAQARNIYYQLSYKPELLGTYQNQKEFTSLLDFLAKKSHTPPDKAPLLEFLERCNFLITNTNVQQELNNWKYQVAKHLGIELNAIIAKINKTPPQTTTTTNPVLLIKIEPHLLDEESFNVSAWLFNQHENYYVLGRYECYTLKALEELIPKILAMAAAKLALSEIKKLFIEIILPLQLFDWNINNIPIKIGVTKRPLGSFYPLAIRSWERIYQDDYEFPRVLLYEKWEKAVLQINHQSVYQVSEKPVPENIFVLEDSEKLVFEDLEESLVFVARKPITGGEFKDMMGYVLSAGIPFALWTLQDQEITSAIMHSIIGEKRPEEWPKILMQYRKQEYKNKSKQIYLNINMLWDHIKWLPPDVDYSILTPL